MVDIVLCLACSQQKCGVNFLKNLNVSIDWIGHQGILICLPETAPYRDQQNLGWPPKAGSMSLILNSKTQIKSDLLIMLLSMVEFEKISVACFAFCSGLEGIISIFRSIKMLNNASRESIFQQYSGNVFAFIILCFKKLLCSSYLKVRQQCLSVKYTTGRECFGMKALISHLK